MSKYAIQNKDGFFLAASKSGPRFMFDDYYVAKGVVARLRAEGYSCFVSLPPPKREAAQVPAPKDPAPVWDSRNCPLVIRFREALPPGERDIRKLL